MNELTITRGDTLETALVIYTDDTQQEEYIPAEGDVIRFAVKRKISDAELHWLCEWKRSRPNCYQIRQESER